MNVRYCLIILCCSIYSLSNAQYSLGMSFIYSDITSNNIGISINNNVKVRHQFRVGLKYHFNDDTLKPLFRYYYRNLYSDKIINRVGLTFNYRYYILKNDYAIKPYIFYNLQYSRIGSKIGQYATDLITGVKMYGRFTLDPVNFFENHIGLGLDIKLDDRMRFFIGFCGGRTFMTGLKNYKDVNSGKPASAYFTKSSINEFSWLFNTGLTYPISKQPIGKVKK